MKQKAFIVVGLGYGDEGKGTMVDYLVRRYDAGLVVRYNGGSQAAHNVVTDDGLHHTFAQIGSGSFVPGVKTLVSQFMLWDPIALAYEVAEFSKKVNENILDRHFIDGRAPVITPFHIATNCIREWMRGGGRHGSCGKGVGETAADLVYYPGQVLRARDLADDMTMMGTLREIQARKHAELEVMGATIADLPKHLRGLLSMVMDTDEVHRLARAYGELAREYNIIEDVAAARMVRNNVTVFEGAQGMLLDEWHGFHPYTTWSTITPKNALAILEEARFTGGREIIGVTRTFGTRHGAGPFVTYQAEMRNISPGEHNGQNEWQGNFRVGGFDAVQFRYALECAKRDGGIDTIALTHLDILEQSTEVPVTEEYRYKDATVRALVPNFNQDLEYQERMTHMLEEAVPVKGGVLKDPDQAIEYIGNMAQTNVKYLSFGPKTADKTENEFALHA
jgi:adenylosuccinate synthase